MSDETIQRPTTPETNAARWAAAAAETAQDEAKRAHPPRTFPEVLPVKLSDKEISDRAKRAAAARARVTELEAKKKSTADHWKAQIELAENDRDANLDAIASGVEERPVECVETFEWRTGTVVTTRTDTGERIRERAMTSLERQPSLPKVDTAWPVVDGGPGFTPPEPGQTATTVHADGRVEVEDGPTSHDGDEPSAAAIDHDTEDDDLEDGTEIDDREDWEEVEVAHDDLDALALELGAAEGAIDPPSPEAGVDAPPKRGRKPRATNGARAKKAKA